MPAPKLENFLFCRDAEVRPNGLATIHELFSGLLLVPGPGLFPRVTVVLMLSGMQGISKTRTTYEIKVENELIASGGAGQEERDPTFDYHIHRHEMANFPVSRPGVYTVRIGLEYDTGIAGVYSSKFRVAFLNAAKGRTPDQ